MILLIYSFFLIIFKTLSRLLFEKNYNLKSKSCKLIDIKHT